MKKIPLFKSHYSIGRSILTLEAAGTSKPTEPDSIIDMCIVNNIKEVFLIEDNLSGYLEALKNTHEAKLKLRFGVRFTVCSDMLVKDEASLASEHRVIVMVKNDKGFEQLIKMYAEASKRGFYYRPRIDFKTIHELWSDDLVMCIPFYDSFVHENFINGRMCVPEFRGIKPIFFEEDNDFMFDDLISRKLKEVVSKSGAMVVKTQTVYYYKRDDFINYLTFRCINNRSTLGKPELEFFSSKDFCLENAL